METTYFKISEEWYGINMIITVTFKSGNYAGRIYQYNHDEVYDNTIWHYGTLPCWEEYGYFQNTRNIPTVALRFVTEIF